MSNGILDRVADSLRDFCPKTQREFVALQIARRFNDVPRLAAYLNVAREHPKRVLLEGARLAMLRHELNRTSLPDLFFEIMAAIGKETRV